MDDLPLLPHGRVTADEPVHLRKPVEVNSGIHAVIGGGGCQQAQSVALFNQVLAPANEYPVTLHHGEVLPLQPLVF
ncbi:hypothetical protein D9M68_940670 [compost metagenome]